MPKDPAQSSERELVRSLRSLEQTIRVMPKENPSVFYPSQNLFLHFLRGVVYGLGVLVAAAIVIPLLLMTLRSVEWVPMVGDFVTRVIERIEGAQPGVR